MGAGTAGMPGAFASRVASGWASGGPVGPWMPFPAMKGKIFFVSLVPAKHAFLKNSAQTGIRLDLGAQKAAKLQGCR
jgi:hypothetical protein